MLIGIQDLCKYFGDEPVLLNVTLSVEKGDRVGIIGENGAGKTTLLKLICGEYLADEGDITLVRGARLGYLEQNSRLDPTLDVYGEMKNAFKPVLEALARMQELEHQMAADPDNETLLEEHADCSAVVDAADGYHMDTQIQKVLNGMGFDASTHHKRVAVLSGGEYTRLRLAKLLLARPEVLVLDEPTNHLDFTTMEWLEGYLNSYSGAVLVVSHDRYFLDTVCNRIWEVEDCRVDTYKGNYSAYLPQKEMAVNLQQKQHDADVAKAAKLEDYVNRNLVRASTTKMAQSRRRQLEKMEITEAPRSSRDDLRFRFEFDLTPYKEVLTLKELTIRIGERVLVKPLSMQVLRGEKLVIAGPNGAGKSTLMQVLDGRRRASGGFVRLGSGVKFSVFEQLQGRRGGTVEDALWNQYPSFTELEVRSHLAKFGFKGEDVFKPCDGLSGGELARLRFSEIVLERANLLFLDEPTNHLDIFTRDSLTAALEEYEGTLLLITHDRYLMKRLACPILYLDSDGSATLYKDFEAMMGRGAAPAAAVPDKAEKAAPKQGYGKEQRRRRAELRATIKAAEDEIEELGVRMETLEAEIVSEEVLRDHVLLSAKCDELEAAKQRQSELYDQWAELSEEQEAMEAEFAGN